MPVSASDGAPLGRPPRNLTAEQKAAWRAIAAGGRFLTGADHALVLEYVELVDLKAKANAAIEARGLVLEDGRLNPAYRIRRDTLDRMLKLLAVLMATPKARAQARAQGVMAEGGPGPATVSGTDDEVAGMID